MLALLAIASPAAFAEPKVVNTQKTSSHVSVFTLPVWFAPQLGFSLERVSGGCCADKKKKVSLEAAELRVSYETLLGEFSEENLKNAGMELKLRSDFIWNGSNATLMKVFQNGKKTVGKWLLIVDRGAVSWMISGLYDAKDSSRGAAVLAMIQSVFWENDAAKEHFTKYMAPFGSIDTGKTAFKLAGLRQDAFVYTQDGEIPTKSPDGALFVVSRRFDTQLMPEGRLSFAKEALNEVEPGGALEISAESDITADGLPGVEVIANTTGESQKLIYQAILFGPSDSTVMVGIARGGSIEALEAFHTLALSYTSGK